MTGRTRRWSLVLAAMAGFFWGSGAARAGDGPTLRLVVNTHDLPRHLIHSRIDIPCRPGKLALWYPKWVPGTHAPCGPIQDVAGLRIETPDGKPVPWHRDETDVYRVVCEVPEGVESVRVRLDVICNKPAVDAAGYLTYGNESIAIINWATCLMYPEGPSPTRRGSRRSSASHPRGTSLARSRMRADSMAPPAGSPLVNRCISPRSRSPSWSTAR